MRSARLTGRRPGAANMCTMVCPVPPLAGRNGSLVDAQFSPRSQAPCPPGPPGAWPGPSSGIRGTGTDVAGRLTTMHTYATDSDDRVRTIIVLAALPGRVGAG